MNWWVYLGWGIVVLILLFVFVIVIAGIFVCIEQYFEDRDGKGGDIGGH